MKYFVKYGLVLPMAAITAIAIATTVVNKNTIDGYTPSHDGWKSKGEQVYIEKGCVDCHGVDAMGTASAPRLAGLSAEYIIEQLEDFQDGTRMNLTMEVMAWQVEGLESIVASYLASRPIPKEY
jgi:cytochrome c553